VSATKFSMSPSIKFFKVWADALKVPEEEQWNAMCANAWAVFSKKPENQAIFADWKEQQDGSLSDKDLVRLFMDPKVYGKCTALRRSMKKKFPDREPPAYPRGRTKGSIKKRVNYEEVWALFE